MKPVGMLQKKLCSKKYQRVHGDACNKKSINEMPKPRRKVDCKDIQLYSHFVFVVDSSGSIGKEYWDEKMVPFVANVVDGLIPTQTNISFVWFSSELVTKTIQLPWGYADVKKYLKANAPYLGHHTFTLEAMAEAYAILEKDIHSKHNVIVLISDGVPNNGIHGPRNDYIRETMEYMDVMKEFYNSTMVYTVGIGETLRTVPFQTEFRHIDDPTQRTSIQMTGETVLKHISRKGCYRAICDLNYQAMDKTNATYVHNDWKMEDERYTHVGDFETLEEGKLAELVRGMC